MKYIGDSAPAFRAILVCLLLAVFIAAEAAAQPENGTETGSAPTETETGGEEASALKRFGSTAEEVHEKISIGVLTSAKWLDSFFRNEVFQVETNETTAELGVSAFIAEGSDADVSTSADLRLVLPHLENRLHLLVSGKGEGEELTQEETRRSAALRYFVKATREETISADGGMTFAGFEPVYFWRARYRKTRQFDVWRARFTQWLKSYTNDGYEIQTTFDFDRPLGAEHYSRTTLNGQWFERKNGYFYNLAFVIFHPFDADRAVFYEWNNSFATRPYNRLEGITLRVKLRARVWRKWLVAEAAPQLSFPRDRDFETVPGITLKLEADFGYIP